MADKANKELRAALKAAGLFHWQIADIIGVNEITLGRWLRKPLPADKEQQILQAIDALKGGVENE